MGDDGRGTARVNMEGMTRMSNVTKLYKSFDLTGDVSLSAEDRPPSSTRDPESKPVVEDHLEQGFENEHDEDSWLMGHTARYLLAGGIAGAGAPCFYLPGIFCYVETRMPCRQYLGLPPHRLIV